MTDIEIWYSITGLLGLLVFPVSFVLYKRLPDRGYTFSKTLGLLLVSLVAWWIGNLKWLPFDQLTCWIAVLAVGLAGNLLLFFHRRLCQEMWDWFSRPGNLRVVVVAELVFLAAYVFILNLRS